MTGLNDHVPPATVDTEQFAMVVALLTRIADSAEQILAAITTPVAPERADATTDGVDFVDPTPPVAAAPAAAAPGAGT